MSMRGFKFVVLSCLLVSLARAEIPVHLVGQLGGQSQAIAISQDASIAYLGVGPRVVVLDVSDSNNVREIAQSEVLPEVVEDIVIRDGYAYVADGYAGLYIMDVSDANVPAVVGRWNYSEDYRFPAGCRVCLSGDYAYFAGGPAGLHVIDISNPTEPNCVSVVADVSPWALAISDGYAYVDSNANGITVIDVSDPAQPTIVPQSKTFPHPAAIEVVDGYAYVAGHQDNRPGLFIMDASDPLHLAYISRCDVAVPGELTIAEKRAYVSNGWGGVDIIRISDPRLPSRIGGYATVGYVEALAVSGGLAYIAEAYAGLEVVDISSPTDPVAHGDYVTTSHQDVAVSSPYAYLVSAYDGLQVVDISNPAEPAYVSWLDLDYAGCVTLGKSHVFVGDGWNFKVIDVSDLLEPVVIALCDVENNIADAIVVDRYAYLAAGQGLAVIDVFEPYHPIQVGWADASGYVYGVSVMDDYAYVTGVEGVDIIDVSNPMAPVSVSRYLQGKGAYKAAVSEGCAFLASGSSGLQVIDVSDPFLPGRVGSLATYFAHDIIVDQRYGLLLDYYEGLKIIDISSPAYLASLGGSDVAGYSNRMVLAGQHAYIASESGGFVILKIDWPEDPHSGGL